MRSFAIEVNGHCYQAAWKAFGPDTVEVVSDYGRSWAPLEGRAPEEVARDLLQKQVASHNKE